MKFQELVFRYIPLFLSSVLLCRRMTLTQTECSRLYGSLDRLPSSFHHCSTLCKAALLCAGDWDGS